jgi:tetratricopeptide (TPR) repeat protein
LFKARYNRGKCLILLKCYEEAVSDLDAATSIKAGHAAAHEYLAEAYLALGNIKKARYHKDIADELRGSTRG